MKDFMYQENSQTRDELMHLIMDSAGVILNNHESIRKPARSLFQNDLVCVWAMQDVFSLVSHFCVRL
jgi:hypothetical protein